MTAATISIFLVDDLRVFRQDVVPDTAWTVEVARSSGAAVTFLQEHEDATFAQMWLDHDLGDATGTNDTAGPVVHWLCAQAFAGHPLNVAEILVHTTNGPAGDWMVKGLTRAGYTVHRVAASTYLTVDEALYTQAIATSATQKTITPSTDTTNAGEDA